MINSLAARNFSINCFARQILLRMRVLHQLKSGKMKKVRGRGEISIIKQQQSGQIRSMKNLTLTIEGFLTRISNSFGTT